MPFSWAFSSPWEDYFTVVQWDQRGVGKNAAGFNRDANLPKMTLEQHVKDAVQVIEHLRRELGKDHVVVLGYSWGSVIGVQVAADRPDLLSVYVGTGQATSRRSEAILFSELLTAAEQHCDLETVSALLAMSPYSEPDSKPTLEQMIRIRAIATRYDALWYGQADRRLLREVPYFAPEYTDEDVSFFVQGSRWMQESTLMNRPSGSDVVDRGDVFAVPVVLLQGAYDLYTPWAAAKAWFDGIHAPHKVFVTLQRSSHTAFLEEPGRFLVALLQEVLPLTEGAPEYPAAPRMRRG
jgi:pimeloyl-ACP methyl ester carboxylesterase